MTLAAFHLQYWPENKTKPAFSANVVIREICTLCVWGSFIFFILFKEEEDLDSFASHALGKFLGKKGHKSGKWASGLVVAAQIKREIGNVNRR